MMLNKVIKIKVIKMMLNKKNQLNKNMFHLKNRNKMLLITNWIKKMNQISII